MRDGRYDKVYDLRKGDQVLVAFYEHSKHAHAGRGAAKEAFDVARIKALRGRGEAGAAKRDPAVGFRRAGWPSAGAKEKSLGG